MLSPRGDMAGESVGAETAGLLDFLNGMSEGEKAHLMNEIDQTSLKSSNSKTASHSSIKIW